MSDLVLVTGISGFLGGHVALELLKAGYRVRGSVRSLNKADKVRATLAKHGGDVAQLEFVALDLLSDAGWTEAMDGVRYVLHVASPFVAQAPKDKMELIRPAVDGTERALKAAFAAEVERVVLTSSSAAVMYGYSPAAREGKVFTGADWTQLEGPGVTAYIESKTRAERRAWEIAAAVGRTKDLAVINPAWIMGPLLDEDPGTSAVLAVRLMQGTVPAAPNMGLPMADVRDVAEMHRIAMTKPEAGGRRFVMASRPVTIMEAGQIIGKAMPDYAGKMPKFRAPDWMVRLIGLFDADVRASVGELGSMRQLDPGEAEALLGRKLRTPEEAIIASAQSVAAEGLA